MKNALIIYGGLDAHEPRQCAELVASWLREQDFEVELTGRLNVLKNAERLQSVSLIVLGVTIPEISTKQCRGLLDAVAGGVGLAGWHGTAASFHNSQQYRFMLGGQFAGHPGDIADFTVNIAKTDDPIMAGLKEFRVHSEQYYLLVDPSNEVLATTTFGGEHCDWVAGTVMPVAWKRRYGQGRVFYSSLGHNAAELEIPEVRAITQRGLLWANRSESGES
jgi:type 1 glutamine amidotransferase